MVSQELVKFEDDMAKVARFFDNQNIPFIVVGSGALLMCGIPLGRNAGDIDVEVLRNEKSGKFFTTLQEVTCDKNPDYVGDNKPFTFFYKGIKVNVWLVDNYTHRHIIKRNNIRYATAYSVLKQKMAYKRKKDYEDLNHIIKAFLEL